MKAVRVVEPGKIEVTEVPEPADPQEVLVRIHRVGICGTDVKVVAGKIPVEYPKIVGHEMIGEIVSAPPESPYGPGTRVLADPAVACGWCHLCQAGKPHLCINGGLMGRDTDGVFTEYTTVPFERLIPVPDNVSDRAAGLLQVLGTNVHAMKAIDPFPGQVAVVIGLGVSGQILSQLLTLRGMTVVGVTRSEWKRELALELGAAAVAPPDGAQDVIDELTFGRGPDLVVEAVGKEATLSSAIEMAATGGEILVFGTITGGNQGLPYYQLYHKELTLHNPRAALVGDYADGVALAASGVLRLEPIVSHELTLEDADRAFELVHDPSSMKVLMAVG